MLLHMRTLYFVKPCKRFHLSPSRQGARGILRCKGQAIKWLATSLSQAPPQHNRNGARLR